MFVIGMLLNFVAFILFIIFIVLLIQALRNKDKVGAFVLVKKVAIVWALVWITGCVTSVVGTNNESKKVTASVENNKVDVKEEVKKDQQMGQKEALKLFEEAKQKISENKLDEAKELLNKSISITKTGNNSEALLNELNKINNTDFFNIAISKMSEKELQESKNDTLVKQYMSNGVLNTTTNKNLNAYVKQNYATITEKRKQAELEKQKQLEAKANEELEKKVASLFYTAYDGSNNQLTKFIKKSMNDPKSYKHDETKYRINKDKKTIYVVQSFRGKNGFGALVLNSCSATQDIETGDLTDIDCNN